MHRTNPTTDRVLDTPKPSHTSTTQKLYLENTLLRVSGALFSHDAKRARTRTAPIELNSNVADKRITIRVDPEYGQPGPLAHKVFVALMSKHSGYGRPVQREISFRQRELARLIGREWSGDASQQFVRALQEIHHTFVKASFQSQRSKLWQEHSFNIFPEITISRRTEKSPVIEACVVALAEPVLASLRDSHFTCLNYALMGQLSTIGQALYMRLFFHFANLYEEMGKSRLSVTKRYDDICVEWLGGLTVLRYRSSIERDQLGPHLNQLRTVGFLASYALDETSDGEGFKISFRPGPTFIADYERYYLRRAQGELQWEFHEERRDIQEPLQAVRLFIEKRTGNPLSAFFIRLGEGGRNCTPVHSPGRIRSTFQASSNTRYPRPARPTSMFSPFPASNSTSRDIFAIASTKLLHVRPKPHGSPVRGKRPSKTLINASVAWKLNNFFRVSPRPSRMLSRRIPNPQDWALSQHVSQKSIFSSS